MMKKYLCALLLVFILVLGMSVTAFGDPSGGPIPYDPPPDPLSVCIIGDGCDYLAGPGAVQNPNPYEDDQGEDQGNNQRRNRRGQ